MCTEDFSLFKKNILELECKLKFDVVSFEQI